MPRERGARLDGRGAHERRAGGGLTIAPSACPTGLGWDLLADATGAVVKSGSCTATSVTGLESGTYRLQAHLGSGGPGAYALSTVAG
jgi:hypothetical protein